jgi:hypothetical protein
MAWWHVFYQAPVSRLPGLTPIVAYWVLLSATGLAFKVTNIRASSRSRREVRGDDPAEVGLRALMELISQLIMAFGLTFSLLAGVVASVASVARPPAPALALRSLLLLGALELVVTPLAAHAFLVWLTRRLVRRRMLRRLSRPAVE